jgi:hypothetical protein
MMAIKSSLRNASDKEKWAARGATFVAKVKATKLVWFPPDPLLTGERAAGIAAKASTQAATGAAKKTTGAAKKTTRPAKKTTGAAKKTTGAAKKTPGAAKKTTGAAKRTKDRRPERY